MNIIYGYKLLYGYVGDQPRFARYKHKNHINVKSWIMMTIIYTINTIKYNIYNLYNYDSSCFKDGQSPIQALNILHNKRNYYAYIKIDSSVIINN